MTDEKIARINALARKSKAQGLTEGERMEQDILRREYIDAVKASLSANLDNTYIVDEQGNKLPIKKK